MLETNYPLKVFLIHTNSDENAVHTLYRRLTRDGWDARINSEDLLPGQDRAREIRKAVQNSDVVVVCLSQKFNRAGWQQREVRLALDTAMEQPEGEIFIIPVRLEQCDIPESLRQFQWVDLFDEQGYRKLMRALRLGAERKRATLPELRDASVKEVSATIGYAPVPTEGQELLQRLLRRLKRLHVQFDVKYLVIPSFLIALFVLLFGNSIYEQMTGHSIFTGPPTLTPTAPVAPTPDSLAYLLIKSETQSDGTLENTVNLSINAVGVGQLLLTSPTKMNLGDSEIVRLSITPDSALALLSSVSVATQNSDLLPDPLQFNDRIDIYPVMQAELSGTGFEITPDIQSQKVILSDKTTEWVWSIKPKEEGTHLISVRISIPVRVDGVENVLDTTIKNIPTVIKVTKSLQRRIDDMSPFVIPALIGLTGVLVGAYVNSQLKQRERQIAELEKRVARDLVEKQTLAKEIARIKAIPFWQFWRKR